MTHELYQRTESDRACSSLDIPIDVQIRCAFSAFETETIACQTTRGGAVRTADFTLVRETRGRRDVLHLYVFQIGDEGPTYQAVFSEIHGRGTITATFTDDGTITHCGATPFEFLSARMNEELEAVTSVMCIVLADVVKAVCAVASRKVREITEVRRELPGDGTKALTSVAPTPESILVTRLLGVREFLSPLGSYRRFRDYRGGDAAPDFIDAKKRHL